MKFSGEYRVNANDMDVNSIVSASGVMRFMQDAAFSQMEDAGMSYGRLVSEYGAAFSSPHCVCACMHRCTPMTASSANRGRVPRAA